ncbi:MAG: transposase [Bacteroidota bacterium]
MGRKYAIRDQEQFHFVTFTVVNWIDIFIRNEYKDIFVESVSYCQREKGLLVGAWCIMTSHVHMIVSSDGTMPLQDIIRDLKSYTSRHIRKSIEGNLLESRREWLLGTMGYLGKRNKKNKDFQLWQQHYHPIELSCNEILDQRLTYVHENPVAAGFVNEVSDWIYSSAGDYEGRTGMIKICFLE